MFSYLTHIIKYLSIYLLAAINHTNHSIVEMFTALLLTPNASHVTLL